MKFTCDRCGKRFSSVDEPAPGRVYRIRCRCGNAIEIKAPHLMPDAAPRRKGGMPLREDGGVPSAIPPLPAGPRSATPAGDGGAPVRHGGTSARLPAPAVTPGRPEAFRPPGGGAVPAAVPGPDLEHPQATPASAFMTGGRPASGTVPRTIPPPVIPSPRAPAPPPRRPDRAPPTPDLAALMSEIEVPADDPFAAAAAHAAKIDSTASSFPSPRAPARPSSRKPGRSPVPADERSAELLIPREDDEAPVDLSTSEQYALAPKKKPGRGKLLAAAAVLLVAGGAAGAYVWKFLGGPTPRAQPRVEKLAPPPVAPAPAIPPPAEPKVATPVPAPAQPAAEPAVPPPAAAAPTPVPLPPPPVVAAPAPPPVEPSRPARLTAAERREAARRAAAERKAEAARKAEERRAETARRAEERKAEAARKAEADRIAREDRQADAAKRAEADRIAREERAAEAAKKAEADRAARAEAERRAEEARKADAARRAEADRAAAAKAEADRKAAEKPKPPPPAEPPKQVAAAKTLSEGLDPAELQAVIRANRASIEACVEKALADPATASYAGKKIAFLILVSPNGKAEAAVEDPDLDASAFGTCLHRAVARMSFPQFRGEEVGARIPLVLGAK